MPLLLRWATLGLVFALAACERAPRAVGPDMPPPGAQRATDDQDGPIGPGVIEALRRDGRARVVVALANDDIPDVARGAPRAGQAVSLAARQRRVAAAQDEALAGIGADELRVRRRFATVPAFAGVVRSEAALRRLASKGRVRRIDLDVGGTGTLANSVPHIGANLRHATGNTGAGIVVGILDTGIDTDHPDLAGAVVDQACFGDDDDAIDGVGFCPNGSDRQTGAGAAEDDAGHGTHVAGIVGSRGTTAARGVAPGAGIVAIKVTDNCTFSGCFYAFSEIVAGLDYIITNNAALRVQVINMSFGTSSMYTGDCDNSTAFNMAGASAINTLRNMGVIAFAAAGNSSSTSQMGSPACLSNVVSVGAADNLDVAASFTNSAANTDVFAPGVGIVSLRRDGGTTTSSGTSMASPHAAGCAALILQAGDATTPGAIETGLETSAFTVTRNGLVFPRIDCSPRILIPIDIMPSSSSNPVSLSSRTDGRLPVAVLSAGTFDAVALVNPALVTLGDGAGTDTPVALRKNGTPQASAEDVNGDGRADLLLQFEREALRANGDLTASTTALFLRGALPGGRQLEGTDVVRVVP